MTRTPEDRKPEECRSDDRKRREILLDLADLPGLSPEEARLLAKHFEAFSETTNKLVEAHKHLQSQIQLLVEELESKNRQLESVNRELAGKMQETEEVRDFLDRLIDSMETGLIALDREGNVTRLNRSARRLLEWRDRDPARLEDLLEPGMEDALGIPGEFTEYPKSGEIRLRKSSGDTVLVRYTAVPLAPPSGKEEPTSSGTLVVFEDLSQLRLLEHKLRRADRLAALGELAAGVAHEMRNPLATMRGFLQLLPTEYEDPDFRKECSTRLIREIDRLARLTDELLELSRPIQPENLSTDLGELLQEVLDDQAEALRQAHVEVSGSVGEKVLLPLDRERMKQVLLNIVINALQAMPKGGRLDWRLDTRFENWGEGNTERRFAVLSIADTGVGIESRHRESLFDPFFTTKDQGTGLGLAICNRIVEEHGGFIQVESQPGKGSTFTIYFPVEGTGSAQLVNDTAGEPPPPDTRKESPTSGDGKNPDC